jgi:DNA-binding transcriptional ArsR family regulator
MLFGDMTAVKARFFKALSDKTRVAILEALREKKQMNVGEICEDLDMEQSTISHHLRCLRNCGLVKTKKEGKQVFYSLNGEIVEKLLVLSGKHVKALAEEILSCEVLKR